MLRSTAAQLIWAYSGSPKCSSPNRPLNGRSGAVTPIPIFEDVRGAVHELPGTSVESIAEGISKALREISSDSTQSITIKEQAQQWREQHSFDVLGERLDGMVKALARDGRHPTLN